MHNYYYYYYVYVYLVRIVPEFPFSNSFFCSPGSPGRICLFVWPSIMLSIYVSVSVSVCVGISVGIYIDHHRYG